jgi:hypothetical protein
MLITNDSGPVGGGQDARTADFFEFTNNYVQVVHRIFWITENDMKVP